MNGQAPGGGRCVFLWHGGWSTPIRPSVLDVRSDRSMRSLAVIALDGRTLSDDAMNGNAAQVDLSPLPAGIYLLNARCVDDTLLQHRFARH